MTCRPVEQRAGGWPLHLFAHGDGQGMIVTEERVERVQNYFEDDVRHGLLRAAIVPDRQALAAYFQLVRTVASYGLFVIAYNSCEDDRNCHDGQLSFLEALEALAFVRAEPSLASHIDLARPYSASGHSTGGRVVLMLAALRDVPSYLSAAPDVARLVADDHRQMLAQLGAVAALHPDQMDATEWQVVGHPDPLNPDVANFNVTSMPVLVVTGERDFVEPPFSAWKLFDSLATPQKVFLNLANHTHNSVLSTRQYAALAAHFSLAHTLDDPQELACFYPHSLRAADLAGVGAATLGMRNNGGDRQELSFVSCTVGTLCMTSHASAVD
jgi:hypothetical protein